MVQRNKMMRVIRKVIFMLLIDALALTIELRSGVDQFRIYSMLNVVYWC